MRDVKKISYLLIVLEGYYIGGLDGNALGLNAPGGGCCGCCDAFQALY